MKFKPLLLGLVFLQLSFSLSSADVRLPALLSNHMVLQRSAQTPVWGIAESGEEVSVVLAGARARTQADSSGKWEVALDLTKTGPGPFKMEVKGKNQIAVEDVMVGEVWVASGQSNMEFKMATVLDSQKEIETSANSLVRQFVVKQNPVAQPQEDCEGAWTVAGPETTRNYSAVGYYFSRALARELKRPVGVINSSFGGTAAEVWTSAQALDSDPDLKKGKDRVWQRVEDYPAARKEYDAKFGEWLKATGREDHLAADLSPYNGPEINAAEWKTIELPGKVAISGASPTGAIWIRHDVNLTGNGAKSPIMLSLGAFDGYETIYVNGKKLSEVTYSTAPDSDQKRLQLIPATLLKEGRNVLAIRFYIPVNVPEIKIKPGKFIAGPEALAGAWQAKVEYELPKPTKEELKRLPEPLKLKPLAKSTPTWLYNGMIHPLLSYRIAGVIWYQGETNAVRAFQYRKTFPLMIQDWRARWGLGDIPFYFCQLPSYRAKRPEPSESDWAELRESQTLTTKLPGTAQAVLIDMGEANDIHPRFKLPVGERLAAIALNRNYGQKRPDSGPVFESVHTDGSALVVKFSETGGGLVARPLPETYLRKSEPVTTAPLAILSPDSEVQGFAICGQDGKWVWAQAKISGDTVRVWSSSVSEPKAVRYAWADNPTCNLFNKVGLPAAPFRTDDFKVSTEDVRYFLKKTDTEASADPSNG